MSTPLKPLETINLQANNKITEKMIEDTIRLNPLILGLGELEFKDVQKPLGGGIVDLILDSKAGNMRFVVEI